MAPTLRLLFTLPLLCCALAATAIGHGAVKDRDASLHDDRMDWRQDGLALHLRGATDGVLVEATNAFGLKTGDVITTLGRAPVRTVQSLVDALRAQAGHSAALQVRGTDGKVRTVRLSPSQYIDLLPPPPPAPPMAPPPPPPP